MTWERIDEATLGQALIATMRSEREGLRVYPDNRSAIQPEQVAQLIFGQSGAEFGYVVPYLRSSPADAGRDKPIGTVVRTALYAVHSAMKVNQTNEADSEAIFKERFNAMQAYLEGVRSFGYGLDRVEHGHLQMPRDIEKRPSERFGEFHYVAAQIAVRHWYYVKAC